jgi:hypothetical protein
MLRSEIAEGIVGVLLVLAFLLDVSQRASPRQA